MSTQSVFDSKFNIVAVDPDKSQVIQIPGTEFQAPAVKELYQKISIIPNYRVNYYALRDVPEEYREEYEKELKEIEEADARAGVTKIIGVGVDHEIAKENNFEAFLPESYRFRVADLHVGYHYSNGSEERREPEFDQYFVGQGWRHKLENRPWRAPEDHNSENHHIFPVTQIKCYKGDWEADGKTWYGTRHYLAFNVEICTGAMVEADLSKGVFNLQNEPLGNLYTLPVRVYWDELE